MSSDVRSLIMNNEPKNAFHYEIIEKGSQICKCDHNQWLQVRHIPNWERFGQKHLLVLAIAMCKAKPFFFIVPITYNQDKNTYLSSQAVYKRHLHSDMQSTDLYFLQIFKRLK